MPPLRTARMDAGLSQRALAERAGVAFRTVQRLEWGRLDPRRSTLEKLARALGRPVSGLLAEGGPSAAESCGAVLRDGPDSWKTHLFEFVDAFRRRPSFAAVEAAPPPACDTRTLALWAPTVESLCAAEGVRVPWWCAGIGSLEAPWFVAGVEALKASALAESPAPFRRRNVFVLANFLERA